MPRVRFIAATVYETGGLGIGPRYAAGEVHDLRADLARRWISRGVAVPAEDAPAPAAPEPAPEPPPAPAVPEPPSPEPPAPAAYRRHLGGGRWTDA